MEQTIKESREIKECQDTEWQLFLKGWYNGSMGLSEFDCEEVSGLQLRKIREYLKFYPDAYGVKINSYKKDDDQHIKKICADRENPDYNCWTFSFDFIIKEYSQELDDYLKNRPDGLLNWEKFEDYYAGIILRMKDLDYLSLSWS